MAFYLKSTAYTRMLLMVDSSDHITGKTGLTVTVTLSKAGGAFAAAGGTITEVSSGWYKIALTTTDTNTAGDLAFHCTATGADPTDFADQIVDPTAATLGVNLVNISGSAVSTTSAQLGVNAVQVNGVSASSVTTINANLGTTQPVNFTGTGASALAKSDMVDVAGSAVSTSSAQIGVNVVNAGGTAWGSGAITANAIASSAITSAKFAAGAITATVVADGTIDRATFAADTGLQTIRSNTAQAGASTSITLDASASATDSFYVNNLIVLTGGTGVGQARFITAYTGSTKVATVTAWTTNPDNTTTFAILPFDAIPGATAPTAAQVATAVWTDLLASSDFSTASSIGALLKADIDATISSRLASSGYTTPPTASTIAGAVWDETRSSHTTSGTFGQGVASVQGNVTGSVGSVTGAVGSVTGAVGSVTGNVGGNVSGSVGSVTGAVGSVTGNVGGNVVGSVGSVTAGVTVSTNNDKTGYAMGVGGIGSTAFAAGAIDSSAVATSAENAIADALLDRSNAVETGLTPRGALRLTTAALAGVLAGAATTTVTINNAVADSKTRITATVDADGNRTAVSTDTT